MRFENIKDQLRADYRKWLDVDRNKTQRMAMFDKQMLLIESFVEPLILKSEKLEKDLKRFKSARSKSE